MARCDVCGNETNDERCPVDGSVTGNEPVALEETPPVEAPPAPKKRKKS